MENNKCKILWDFTVERDQEIYGRRPDVIVPMKNKKSLPDNKFCLPLWWKSWYQRIRKNRTLSRFGTRVEKNMWLESQGYNTCDRRTRNKTHKVKKLVKGNKYRNSDNTVAQNCLRSHCSNPPKGSWGLSKLVFIGPQEHKSAVKTVCYGIR